MSRLVIVNSASLTPEKAAEPQPGTPIFHIYDQVLNGDPRHDAEAVSVTTGHITDDWAAKKRAITAAPVRASTRDTFARVRVAYYEEFERLKRETLDWLASGAFTKPTLIVWGVGDPTTTAQDALDVFTMFRTGVEYLRLVCINQCGHWPFREYPHEFVGQVRAFLGTQH